MILADTSPDYAGRIAVAIIVFLVVTLFNLIFSKFKGRSKLIEDVAERYIAERSDVVDDDSPVVRLGTMQRAGVGLFRNDSDIDRFNALVVGRGCTHPFFESDIGDFVLKNKLPQFLRGVSSQGFSLNDDETLYDALIFALNESENSKS